MPLGLFRHHLMQSSRLLVQLTTAFGASCGALLGNGDPNLGLGWGTLYGALCGLVLGKLMLSR